MIKFNLFIYYLMLSALFIFFHFLTLKSLSGLILISFLSSLALNNLLVLNGYYDPRVLVLLLLLRTLLVIYYY